MAYRDFTLTLKHTIGGRMAGTRQETVKAESCHGLLIHRDIYGRGWVIATHGGLSVYGAPTSGAKPIPTRALAREIANYLAYYMPPAVIDGRWTGNRWIQEQPAAARYFRDTIIKQVAETYDL